MLADILLIIGAYLLGSVPHLKLLAKLRRIDLSGDFHQQLWSRGGKVFGVLGIIGEFIKGITSVLAGKALNMPPGVVAAAGLAAVCGQMWPVFSRFDGEKGNSIAVAMVFALVPYVALIGIIPVIISLIVRTVPRLIAKRKFGEGGGLIGGSYSRSLPLGMFACFLVVPFAAWWLGEPREVVWCLAALFILMIIVRRLTAGLRRDLVSGAAVKDILVNARRWRGGRETLYERKNHSINSCPVYFFGISHWMRAYKYIHNTGQNRSAPGRLGYL
jgi:glycerol-3-phosphate acyltransferase PlsY